MTEQFISEPIEPVTGSCDAKRGSSLLAILVVLVIVGLIFWFMTKKNKTLEPSGHSIMKDANIDTSSYKGMLDSAQRVVDEASRKKGIK